MHRLLPGLLLFQGLPHHLETLEITSNRLKTQMESTALQPQMMMKTKKQQGQQVLVATNHLFH
jgi:hypothetical protein